eukprot:gnl/TRDRNA2_/TRDRNA2_28785_c0_seq1.p1 gnl/TRDRNA2_/TRDRNA2_28785_c0~~gnl/TRDRNA2_/TRDRNA2_28785_c0_seq1.p1  ORF type:complete len:206 (+),score=30.92 gnl/TRDRNA2_/TRDRNA2_28785_c0_seq1:54-620(+)
MGGNASCSPLSSGCCRSISGGEGDGNGEERVDMATVEPILKVSDDAIVRETTPCFVVGSGKVPAAAERLVAENVDIVEQEEAGIEETLEAANTDSYIGLADGEYIVTLDKTASKKLGINVDHTAVGGSLPIKAITGGLARQWNQDNPDCKVMEGDCIIEVNGARGDVALLVERCMNDIVLRMTLRRAD